MKSLIISFVKKVKNTLVKSSTFLFILTLALSILCLPSKSLAYPDFISYGYSTCITCHYNGLGGGALNDYGRALLASEIAARDVYPADKEDEDIASESGFLGSKQLPWWIRPGVKYRGLWFKANPGSTQTLEKFINMQEDINLNLFADKKQNVALITTFSYADKYPPHSNNQAWNWYLKESFVRWKLNNNFWAYLGQMEKAFGIRNIDHTAFNRSFNNSSVLGQFDQTLGGIIHLTYPDWDIATHVFLGNTYESEPDKQKGLSLSGEYQWTEKIKTGLSMMQSENERQRWKIAALTSRMGLTKGSSVLAEIGLKEQYKKNENKTLIGNYVWIESLISLRRGYNFLSSVETSKSDMNNPSIENMKWSLGLLTFPLPRTEVRLMAVNFKNYENGTAYFDDWMIQSQLHISY